MPDKDLKRCPFCGGKAHAISSMNFIGAAGNVEKEYPFCEDCGFTSRAIDLDIFRGMSPIEWWNTRPTPQPTSEYVKAIDSLEKALDEQENDGIVSDNDFKDIRHSKDGNNPIAYLTEWLRITRPRTVATKDGSWGELEKRLHLVFIEYANGKVLKMRVKDALSALKSHPTPAKESDHEQ